MLVAGTASLLIIMIGTPATIAVSGPIIGSPDQCAVEPRPDAFFAPFPATVALNFPPQGATPATLPPATPPSSQPGSAETREAIVQLLTQASACENAGDLQRLLALYTEEAAVQAVKKAGSALYLEGQPPQSEAMWTGYTLLDTIVLDNGDIGAVVETTDSRSPATPRFRLFFTFQRTDAGLRLSNSMLLAVLQATPEPAG